MASGSLGHHASDACGSRTWFHAGLPEKVNRVGDTESLVTEADAWGLTENAGRQMPENWLRKADACYATRPNEPKFNIGVAPKRARHYVAMPFSHQMPLFGITDLTLELHPDGLG